ncbi:phage holin family protein [uncultured Flavobacterium sp.]|uniref:phage holin family protein n=1 Tax=uncultured Flavobacterium sp. TaxID=165435 RepID=UPI0030C8C394
MNLLIKLLMSTIVVFVLAHFLPGIAVASFSTALIVAVVLALLNTFLKPILVLLTIPVTIVTLGLFLLVINAVIIMICDKMIDGFAVSGFWYALLFSLLLSIGQSILNNIFVEKS